MTRNEIIEKLKSYNIDLKTSKNDNYYGELRHISLKLNDFVLVDESSDVYVGEKHIHFDSVYIRFEHINSLDKQ